MSIIPICHLNNNPFRFLAFFYFTALPFPQSRRSFCTYSVHLNIFLRFQTGAGAFKIVFYARCKQVFLKKKKTKTWKKIKRNVAFYLHIKGYTKRENKIKYRRRKKQKRKQEKRTLFCLCPPGDAIKLNLNNSNSKITSPISNHLIISGPTILFFL